MRYFIILLLLVFTARSYSREVIVNGHFKYQENYACMVDLNDVNLDSLNIQKYIHTNHTFTDDTCYFTNDKTNRIETIYYKSKEGKLIEKYEYILDKNSKYSIIEEKSFDSYYIVPKNILDSTLISSSHYEHFDANERLRYERKYDKKAKSIEKKLYYPNGNIQEHSLKVKDSILFERAYDINGKMINNEHKSFIGYNYEKFVEKLEYPELMQRAQMEVSFDLVVVLDVEGNPIKIIFSDMVHEEFIKSAIRALKSSKFKPRYKGVLQGIIFPIEFRLT